MLRAFALVILSTIIVNSCAPLTTYSANTPEPAQAVSPSSAAPVTGIPSATPPKEHPPTLQPVTDYVVTGAAEGAPAGCSAQDIAQRLAEMLEAINRGDPQVIDEFFGRKNKAPFQWYSMTEFGRSEAEKNHFVAYNFEELDSYFQKRYKQNEKLQLRSIQVNSWEPERGLVHFGPVVITRHADDLRLGIGGPERLAEGKGAYHCKTQAFVVLGLGMAWEAPMQDTPVRNEAFVLTGEQALEVAVFMNFIRAYNNGHLDEALALLSEDVAISDCDYREVKAVEFGGISQAAEWLRQHISEHDRLIVSQIYNENPGRGGRHVIGVEYSRRSDTTLESLGFPQGIKPKLASKVVFEAGTALIQAFANGPLEGDSNFCRPER